MLTDTSERDSLLHKNPDEFHLLCFSEYAAPHFELKHDQSTVLARNLRFKFIEHFPTHPLEGCRTSTHQELLRNQVTVSMHKHSLDELKQRRRKKENAIM
jgi:hypothetical protein